MSDASDAVVPVAPTGVEKKPSPEVVKGQPQPVQARRRRLQLDMQATRARLAAMLVSSKVAAQPKTIRPPGREGEGLLRRRVRCRAHRPRRHHRRRGRRRHRPATHVEAGHQLMVPIKLLHDRVLVSEEAEGERQSSGGIPPRHRVGGQAALLGEGGRDRSERPAHDPLGDRVLFEPEDRAVVELQGSSFVMLRETRRACGGSGARRCRGDRALSVGRPRRR